MKTKNFSNILNKFDEYAKENGYDDFKFTRAEIILFDRNGVKISKKLGPDWFKSSDTGEGLDPPDDIYFRLSKLESLLENIKNEFGSFAELDLDKLVQISESLKDLDLDIDLSDYITYDDFTTQWNNAINDFKIKEGID